MTHDETGRSDAQGVGPIEVIDSVNVSQEARVRQDVAQAAERAYLDQRGEGDTRGGLDDSSRGERERLRALATQDAEVRVADANLGIEAPLRGTPSFEVEVGPFGRAYAVDAGVTLPRFESPGASDDIPPDLQPQQTGPPPDEGPPITQEPGGAQEVALQGTGDPEQLGPQEQIEATFGRERGVPAEFGGAQSATGPPRTNADVPGLPASPAADPAGRRDVAAIEDPAQGGGRPAKAYQAAAGLAAAPGGFDDAGGDSIYTVG